MADVSLRTLERRFQASGSPEHELAWLCQRVRAGQRLEWASYARLAGLAPQEAAVYLSGLMDQGLVQPPERLGLAASCGHGPARVAAGWVTRTEGPQVDLAFLRLWVGASETPELAFELVRAVVGHLLERATARGAWTPAERQAALDALASCSPEGSWSAQTRKRLSRRLTRAKHRAEILALAARRHLEQVLAARFGPAGRAFLAEVSAAPLEELEALNGRAAVAGSVDELGSPLS